MNLLDTHTYYFELPLYSKISIDKTNEEDALNLINSDKGINAYNPTIKENTTYFVQRTNIRYSSLESYGENIFTTLVCSRTGEKVYFLSNYNKEKKILQKIGQFPSIAHFHISKIKDYQKVLDIEKIKELTRAIGLAANGVGIGSFVYLRRIFEYLLEKEHQKAKKIADWDDNIYIKSKIVERIELLGDFLPKFLVENRTLYGILSVGIHSMSEDDCLKYFETVKIGIELILDEELEKYNKHKKIEEAQKRIGIINQQVKEQQKLTEQK